MQLVAIGLFAIIFMTLVYWQARAQARFLELYSEKTGDAIAPSDQVDYVRQPLTALPRSAAASWRGIRASTTRQADSSLEAARQEYMRRRRIWLSCLCWALPRLRS